MGSVMGQFPLCNGVLFSGCYKVKSIGQWENILVMALGFVDHFRLYLLPLGKSQVCEIEATMEKSIIDTP